MDTNCLFCGAEDKMPGHGFTPNTNICNIGRLCDYCGDYFYSYDSSISLSGPADIKPDDKAKIAAYLRELRLNSYAGRMVIADNDNTKSLLLKLPRPPQPKPIPIVTINEILKWFPKPFNERLNRTLFNLKKLTTHLGDQIDICEYDYPLFYALSYKEMEAMIDALKEDAYIKVSKDLSPKTYILELKSKGHKRIDEINETNINSNQGFVAMWFNPDLDNVYKDGFKQAIEEAGYKIMKIDLKEHNNRIDEEIISEIKKSKFVVADFTGNRGGVYYEVGYAHGLGIPVVFTCKDEKTEKENIHFDIEHYKFIFWKNEKDLYAQLLGRIRETIK